MEDAIFCFCHYGGESVRNVDGSIVYKGGITNSIHAHHGMKFEDFKLLVLDRLKINDEGKFLHFIVKYDPKQFLLLKDDVGVQTLIRCNDDYAHVYVSNSEFCSATQIDKARLNVDSPSHLSHGEVSNHTFSGSSVSTDEQSQLLIGERWKDCITGIGQVFEDANLFREALFKFSMAHRFSYKFTHNKPKFLRVKCEIESCGWEMTAAGDGNTSNVSIRKMQDKHIHSIDDVVSYKPKFRARLMGSVVVDKLFNTPTYLPRQICKDVMDECQVSLSYKQAWKSKEEALRKLDGNVEDSYKLIPWYCNRLIEVMPGTIAEWSCYENGTFKQLFVSYACSIHGFHNGCWLIIFIDGCHLSGPYKGTLLAASTLDAGNGMYSLAYGVVTSECEEDWLWFLEHLKDVIRGREIVIVSDRNPAILNGVNALFGRDNHAYCYHHLQENFSSFINRNSYFKMNRAVKKQAHRILDEISYARTKVRYENAMATLNNFQPKLHEWVLENHPENWSNALFLRQRWDWLNSNVAESFNAWMGEARNYPIGKLMQAHAEKYAQLLSNKVHDLSSWKNGFGKRIKDKINENIGRGRGFSVKARPPYEFEVYELRKGAVVVNFSTHTCTCLEWQMTGIPCPHACCAVRMQNCSIYECIARCYDQDVQKAIYSQLIPGIPTIDMPSPMTLPIASMQESNQDELDDVLYALLPPKTKRPSGRPRKKRIESQFLGIRAVRCSRCSKVGHYRSTCKEPIS